MPSPAGEARTVASPINLAALVDAIEGDLSGAQPMGEQAMTEDLAGSVPGSTEPPD